MAINMLGTKPTDDDSPVCSEADVEAYTTLEIDTGECLVSMMEEGEIRQMRNCLVTLRMTLDYLRIMLSAVGRYVVQEVTLSQSRVETGTLRLFLLSGEGVVCVTLMNVAHVSGLSHHLLSLRRIADARNKYIVTREGIRIVLTKSDDELLAPSCGQLNGLFGYRTDRSSEENVHAAISPGARSIPSTDADINELHCSHIHMHEGLLRKMAKQIGLKLQGQLVPFKGDCRRKGSGSLSNHSPTYEQLSQLNGVLLNYRGRSQ